MTGYILEFLFPTGWRRQGRVYWRLSDAVHAADLSVSDDGARGYRVLPVKINPRPVRESMLDDLLPVRGDRHI